jgi:hypothetical protein
MPSLVLRISRFIAFALLGLGVLLPWFQVPVGLSDNPSGGGYALVFKEPISTVGFKIFVVGVLLGVCRLGFRSESSGPLRLARSMTAGGSLLLVAIGVLYPALTTQRCSELSAHAAWLQTQNESLIQPRGDLFTSQEYAYQPGQPEVNVKQVLPAAFVAIPSPSITFLTDLHLAKLSNIVTWLGYSPAFCQFIGRGWFCAVFGSFLLIVSFIRLSGEKGPHGENVELVYRIIPFLFGGAFAVCVACLFPVMMAGGELAEARTAAADAKFAESLHHLDRAEAWLPIIGYHTDILYQRGWLERRLNVKSAHTQLFSALREEAEGFYSQATQSYVALLTASTEKAVWNEAFRGSLRLAIKDFNSGLIDRVTSCLARLTTLDSTCIKANYVLQMAYLRAARKSELEDTVARFETVYSCWQSLERMPLLASAHRRLADLEFDYHDIKRLGDEMRAAVTP